MASFKAQYNELIKREGNYHSGVIGGKVDKGGETYRGIARKYNPDWAGWKIIDSLKLKGSIAFNAEIPAVNKLAYDYSKLKYWDKLNLDKVKNQSVADIIFEINWGFPSKTFSTVKKVTDYTGAYIAGLITKVNLMDPKQLFSDLVDSYAGLLRNSSEYNKFATGYENRILTWIKKRDNFIIAGGTGLFLIAAAIGLYVYAK